jgi:RNase H-fold protein (predicted Holliday junction resolvase)
MAMKKALSKLLAAPSKIAHNLDWRKVSGSILSLNIGRYAIDLALASHPVLDEEVQHLPAINLKMRVEDNHKVLDRSAVQALAKVVQEHNVCGMVVSWPVQKEGWCGAPCGRVLHTLDQITEQSTNIITSNRPVCLWDNEHHEVEEDSWGRNAVYSQTSDKTVHLASEEQYQDHNTVAADVWNDFCRSHWPELYEEDAKDGQASYEAESAMYGKRPPSLVNTAWLDSYENPSAYMTQATL